LSGCGKVSLPPQTAQGPFRGSDFVERGRDGVMGFAQPETTWFPKDNGRWFKGKYGKIYREH